jgi:ribosome-associated toxin RatA of RatAB toxin-antitoxin module
MGAKPAEQSVEIEGTPADCFAAITDYETFPDWQSAVKDVEVLERDGEGRGSLVDYTIDAKLRDIHYRLRYRYDEPRGITWDYVEGDVKSIDGEYEFEELGAGRTRATYRLAIDPGMFVPGPVRKVLVDQVMRGSVQDLKARVEAG